MADKSFFIASVKHTGKDDEHITWWSWDHSGYTPVLGAHAGRYTLEQASSLNDGSDCIAVPAIVVAELLSPEPYYRRGDALVRWFDQRGPVVDNTRANWKALIDGSLDVSRRFAPKPETFRRVRKSVALEGATADLSLVPTIAARDEMLGAWAPAGRVHPAGRYEPEREMTDEQIDKRVFEALSRVSSPGNMEQVRKTCGFALRSTCYRAMDRLYDAGRIDEKGKPREPAQAQNEATSAAPTAERMRA